MHESTADSAKSAKRAHAPTYVEIDDGEQDVPAPIVLTASKTGKSTPAESKTNAPAPGQADAADPAEGSVTTAPRQPLPTFPNRAVLDEVLYDYLRRADKMGWSPYDLVDQENIQNIARPDRINETQLSAVKTVLFVEDHLPGYLSEYLRNMT